MQEISSWQLKKNLKLWSFLEENAGVWRANLSFSLHGFSYSTFEKYLKGQKTTEVHMSICYRSHSFLSLPSGFWDVLQGNFQIAVAFGCASTNLPRYMILFVVCLDQIWIHRTSQIFFFWDGANRVLCLPTIYGMQNRLLFFYSDQTLAICPAFLDVWQPRQSQNFTWSCRCLTVLLLHYFLQSLEVINEQ